MQLAEVRFSKKVCCSWNVFKLPDDLIIEILIRLPPKCITRFKSVCKSWCMIIKTRKFIEKHMQQAKRFRYFSGPIKGARDSPFRFHFTLDGLILEENPTDGSSRIRNHATNWNLVLPAHNSRISYISMSYLASSEKYKVLNLYAASGLCLDVLTVGVATWRRVELPIYCVHKKVVGSKTIDGVSYMFMHCHDCCPPQLLAYQIEDERFVKIPVPQTLELLCSSGKYRFRPTKFNNKFGVVRCKKSGELHIWGLQDDKKAEWDEIKIVYPPSVVSQYPQISNYIPYELAGTVISMINITLGCHLSYDFKANLLLWNTKMSETIATCLMSLI